MKMGVVDVGGGLRGIYAAGVFDYCMDAGLKFDLGIGVSAGSANLISYAAGQRGRNYDFYAEYAFRKEYMGVGNLLFKKSFIDLDYVYGTLSNSDGENPLDYQAILANPMECFVVATNAETGEAKYFDERDIAQDDYSIFKASSAIPFVCKPYEVRGVPYYDGALGDTIPIQKAFALGCDRLVLILTKPEHVLRTSKKDDWLASHIQKHHPIAAQKLRDRAKHYNEGVALAQEYARQGKLLIVAPDDTCGVDTLTKDKVAMDRLYHKGYQDGRKIPEFFEKTGVYEIKSEKRYLK